MKKEVFLEDILDQILNNQGKLTQNIQILRNHIEYQRSFESHELEAILSKLHLQNNKFPSSNIISKGLPYPVARLVEGMNKQHNDLVKVLFLCDAVECLVRWRFSEMLSLIHSENGELPDTSLGFISRMITRPSMGAWINGFEYLSEQLQHNVQKQWCGNKLKSVLKELRLILGKRNKLAHGDISGNAHSYWTKISKWGTNIFDDYRKLGIEHYALYQGQVYTATGDMIGHCTGCSHPNFTHKINPREEYYFFALKGQSFQIPLTFLLQGHQQDSSPTISHPFYTLSYISTKGKVNTPTSGGSLEYTVIDGEGIKGIKELDEFIKLFKIDKDPSSKESWNGYLTEVTNSVAWDVDQALLNHRYLSSTSVYTTSEMEPVSNSKEDISKCHDV